MIKAVIFDMDGVIIDSETQWKPIETKFLQSLIPTLDEKDLEKFIGTSLDNYYHSLKKDYKLDISEKKLKSIYATLAKEVYGKRTSLMPGFKALVTNLQDKKILLALASSSPRNWIEIVLKRFDLYKVFQIVVSADDLQGEGKPSPKIYLTTAERLQVNPEDCIAIEDSINGVRAAKAARMNCICIPDPAFRNDKRLAIADMIIDSLEDIVINTLEESTN